MTKLPTFLRTLPIFAICVFSAVSLRAQTYAETGDAGTTLATAQATGGTSGNPLSTITGSILNGFDGDFFYITITNPGTFSMSTVGGSTLDTMIHLFTAQGNPLFLNDDAPNGLSLQSNIPAGTFSSLAAGTYLIGISLSGAEPINAANQNLFANGVFSTDIRGPLAGALGPVTGVREATFAESGAYSIFLTGAATGIPEPSTVALLAISGLGLFAGLRRRARRS